MAVLSSVSIVMAAMAAGKPWKPGSSSLDSLDTTAVGNDAIAVQGASGKLASTPLLVRFPGVKAGTPVDCRVGGKDTNLVLEVGAGGEVTMGHMGAIAGQGVVGPNGKVIGRDEAMDASTKRLEKAWKDAQKGKGPASASHADYVKFNRAAGSGVPGWRPSSDQLKRLGLRLGVANKVAFTTAPKGKKGTTVEISIFLYKSTKQEGGARIIVSDVDGTVTKSDVPGQVLPLLGIDWTWPGICKLYNELARRGYQIIYLTARPLSMGSMTKKALWQITQDGGLPKGPVMLSPERFGSAVRTEVIRREPHIMKAALLAEINRAFADADSGESRKPLSGGFGNRPTDAVAYDIAGVPSHGVFIISNKDGKVAGKGHPTTGSVKPLSLSGYNGMFTKALESAFPGTLENFVSDFGKLEL